MSDRNEIVIFVLLAGAAWWFLHENPEAEVRNAHQELAQLLSKAEGAAGSAMIINARILQNMFVDSCDVIGDAEMLVGRYTPEEMASTIIRVQGIFLSIDLTFHELAIEFPAADDAIAKFTAVLVGQVQMEGEEEVGETRAVISRMRKVEDTWLFAEFRLAQVVEN